MSPLRPSAALRLTAGARTCACAFALAATGAISAAQTTGSLLTPHAPLPEALPEPAISAPPPRHPWESVLDRLRLYGDFRVRAESDENRINGGDRWRGRLRLRLGANYSVNDEILVGGRLITGPSNDPRDGNATLGGDFDKSDINLDRLFMTWTPKAYPGSQVTIGKFGHSFARNPVYEELVWFSDVQPEGLVARKTWEEAGVFDDVSLAAGHYIYREDGRGDVGISVAELKGRSALSKVTRLQASTAWYGYKNSDELDVTTVDEYQVLDTILGITYDGSERPWKFALEGIANVGVTTSNNLGWAAGLASGELRRPGDWRFFYQYQVIGNDAVFSPVGSGDLLLDHNLKGHVANVDYRLSQDATLRMRVLQAEPDDPDLAGGFDEKTLRVRFDFNVKL